MTMRSRRVLAIAVALLAPAGAPSAQVVDFSRVSCAQLNRLPAAQKRQIAVWLHGYYTGATQRPFLDMAAAENGVRALVDLCVEKPDTQLLGEEARASLSGSAAAGAPRAVERSPGHIVIEGPATGSEQAAEDSASRSDRPRPVE